jgi:uncharacterized protein
LSVLDPATQKAVQSFLRRLKGQYDVDYAIVFGSRARGSHSDGSDADIAVVLNGPHGQRSSVAIDMAGLAFDAMLETGVLVEALPLWKDEILHPEMFSNPVLLEVIQREGTRV